MAQVPNCSQVALHNIVVATHAWPGQEVWAKPGSTRLHEHQDGLGKIVTLYELWQRPQLQLSENSVNLLWITCASQPQQTEGSHQGVEPIVHRQGRVQTYRPQLWVALPHLHQADFACAMHT